jgi:hypothetical protein
MEIRPIRSQADYAAAVAEIERLWNADPGTDDGDKLDILATLVEKYENERWPIDTSRVDPHRYAELSHRGGRACASGACGIARFSLARFGGIEQKAGSDRRDDPQAQYRMESAC